jgi:hypothetical protein
MASHKNYCLFADMRYCSYFDHFTHRFLFISQGKKLVHMWQKIIMFWSGDVFLGDLL